MLVVTMRIIDVIRLFPIYQHVNFARRNPAAIDAADTKLSSDIQGCNRPLQQLCRNAGIEERAKHHVSANPGETLEVSNAHSVCHPNLVNRQYRIHGARAVSFAIQSHIFESEPFEYGYEACSHFDIECSRQVFPRDLDPDNISVMPYSRLLESQLSQRVFPGFNGRQCFASHWTPVFNARRETGRSRFVPNRESGALAQRSNLAFSQPCFSQRTQDPVLFGCALSGPKITLIVKVLAISNVLKPQLSPLLL